MLQMLLPCKHCKSMLGSPLIFLSCSVKGVNQNSRLSGFLSCCQT